MLRKPAVAGAFYPDNPNELRKLIESCFLESGEIPNLNTFEGNDYPVRFPIYDILKSRKEG